MKLGNILEGVSIIVCTYNGALKLPATLKHLSQIQVKSPILWEVIIVNNHSTDQTAQIARTQWSGSVPFKIVNESRPGLMNARMRGFNEAQYSYLSYIDDDNWVSSDWVDVVFSIFQQHPQVGICGGDIFPRHESPPPPWFETFKNNFAVGCQGVESGDITKSRKFVWGAGMCIRRKALQDLFDQGFVPKLTGRTGHKMLAGEDTELCFGLILKGWHIWYDTRLQLDHFLPTSRLVWSNLRRMYQGFGASHVILDIYQNSLKKPYNRNPESRLDLIARILRIIFKYRSRLSPPKDDEGDGRRLEYDFYKAYLIEFLRLSFSYYRIYKDIQSLDSNPEHQNDSVFNYGDIIPFDQAIQPCLLMGWSPPQTWIDPKWNTSISYIKTIHKKAILKLPLYGIPAMDTTYLNIHISRVYLCRPKLKKQRIFLYINGIKVAKWTFTNEAYCVVTKPFSTAILRKKNPVEIELKLTDAMAPAVVQNIPDIRPLALDLCSIQFTSHQNGNKVPRI